MCASLEANRAMAWYVYIYRIMPCFCSTVSLELVLAR